MATTSEGTPRRSHPAATIIITVIVIVVAFALLGWFILSQDRRVEPRPTPAQTTKLQTHDTTNTSNPPPRGTEPLPDSSGATSRASGNPKVDQ